MSNLSPRTRAGLGAFLVGVGIALMLSARKGACEDCEDSPEATAEAVAAASVEMNGTAKVAEPVTADA